ncbi:MAG: cyclic pyranopterin monophosphate synthase MoaC [Deltaproteobacteria bacterium]|nr:MAG: cyclic pyranopterin monophosphate synthase MoaC [Deltaproteobacteria bacterium]
MGELTHTDSQGRARMVDVSGKDVTSRRAVAAGRIHMKAETLARILAGDLPKGDVLAVARTAGILAAKQTPQLIPLCHPLPIDGAEVSFRQEAPGVLAVEATVRVTARTGVEMEALTAVSVAALTVYDMCKAIDRGMTISDIRLIEKSGGRSGEFRRAE